MSNLSRWLFALALFVSLPAQAARAPRIAILEVRPIDESLQKTAQVLEQVVQDALAREGFETISRADVASLIGYEKQKALLTCSEGNCLAEIGGAIGADHVLTGSLGRIGRIYRLDLRLLDTLHNRVAAVEGAEVDSEEGLVAATREVVGKLTKKLRPAPASSTPAASAAAPAQGGVSSNARPTGSYGPGLAVTALGVGVVAAGTGIFLSGRAFNDRSLEGVPFTKAQEDRASALTRMRIGAGVGLVGLAGVGAGVGLLLTRGQDPARVAVMPVQGGALVAFGGTLR